MSKYCTGWIDSIGKCKWGKCCKKHDDYYMTPLGKGKSKLSVDLELLEDVYSECKPMGVLMFLGITILPFSYYYWYKYKEDREEKLKEG